MSALNSGGQYRVSERIFDGIQSIFKCGSCDDARTMRIIGGVFEKSRYLMDTHTAVAYGVFEDYRAATGDDTPTVVVSTASPFKFADSVLEALGEPVEGSGFEMIDRLEQAGGAPAPASLKSLRGKKVRFEGFIEADKMLDVVRDFLP